MQFPSSRVLRNMEGGKIHSTIVATVEEEDLLDCE